MISNDSVHELECICCTDNKKVDVSFLRKDDKGKKVKITY